MMETAELAVSAILFGFGFYTILYILFRSLLTVTQKETINNFDNSACLVAAIIGVTYFTGGIVSLITEYLTVKLQVEGFTMKDRIFGKYWLWYWHQPLFYISSLLLWVKSIRTKKIIRLIIALLLITSIESIVIYLLSLNREYLRDNWTTAISASIMDWLFKLGIFGIVTLIFHLIKTKIKVFNN